MGWYTKKSLERLKEQVDLVEVISAHHPLKRKGKMYQGLCPFHSEKTPSFTVERGSSHYHCFGCGAHGDALSFIMHHLNLEFSEAAKFLSDRFHIPLEEDQKRGREEGEGGEILREALTKANHFFHTYLLHTEEGERALRYLYDRGLDLSFLTRFEVGFAPKEGTLLIEFMKRHSFSEKVLEEAGLLKKGRRSSSFFAERITFPILDSLGRVVGFSGRRLGEGERSGPKYLNTSETTLFKKSKLLYGLFFSKKRMAKERKAILVEGQIDALRLIHGGFDYTVAGQGTAVTGEQVEVLKKLSVAEVTVAFDGDAAGRLASLKVGALLQKGGLDARIALLPEGTDPDRLLREGGEEAVSTLLKEAKDYLSFWVEESGRGRKLSSPSVKQKWVSEIVEEIRSWPHPIMVHESLKKLAFLTQLPERLFGIEGSGSAFSPVVQRKGFLRHSLFSIEWRIELDLLRWMERVALLVPQLESVIRKNIFSHHFSHPLCRRLFLHLLSDERRGEEDLFSLIREWGSQEEQELFLEGMNKKIHLGKAEEGVVETVQKLLEREWMGKRELLRRELERGGHSEERADALMKEFNTLVRTPPLVELSPLSQGEGRRASSGGGSQKGKNS